jgi:hypothetical protein
MVGPASISASVFRIGRFANKKSHPCKSVMMKYVVCILEGNEVLVL